MAVHAIPNPTKTLTVNFSLETVQEAVKNLNLTTKGFRKTEEDDIMNLYQFHILELLSTGAFVDVTLEEVSKTKTKIQIEVKRALGTFDEWYEVSKAKTHIENLIKGISTILSKGIDNVAKEVSIKQKEQQLKGDKNKKINKIILSVFAVIVIGMIVALQFI